MYYGTTSSRHDLFFDTEKKEGWVNLYRSEIGYIMFGCLRETKEEALNEIKDSSKSYNQIDTIQIKWEE